MKRTFGSQRSTTIDEHLTRIRETVGDISEEQVTAVQDEELNDADEQHERKRQAISKFRQLFSRKLPSVQQKKPSSTPTAKQQKPREKLQQLYLNVGQKDPVTKPFTCSLCGMTFFRHVFEEEKLHGRFHDLVLKGVPYTASAMAKFEHLLEESAGYRVVELKNSQQQRAQFPPKVIKEVLWLIEQDLGSAEILDKELVQDLHVFLCISKEKKTVVGCVVAQRSPVNAIRSSTATKELSQCGIARIWVSRQSRRQGIATRMLDSIRYYHFEGTSVLTCRKHFIFGQVLERQQLAFSEPTTDGSSLAETFTGTKDFLVYRPAV